MAKKELSPQKNRIWNTDLEGIHLLIEKQSSLEYWKLERPKLMFCHSVKIGKKKAALRVSAKN